MADFIGSGHRHEEGDLCPLLVCPGILQRVEAVSLENNFTQACQVMEYLLDLHDRYKDAKDRQAGLDSETDTISFADLEGCKQEAGESRTSKPIEFDKLEDLPTSPTGSSDVLTKVFKCPKCTSQFYSTLKMHFHLALKHQTSSQKTPTGEEIGHSVGASCPFCRKMFFKTKTLKFHKHICLPKLLKLKPRWREWNNHHCHSLHINPMRNLHPYEIKKCFLGHGCICGQNFHWKSLYFQHKKVCKAQKESVSLKMIRKLKSHHNHQKEHEKKTIDTESTALLKDDSMEAKLCVNLIKEGTLLSEETQGLNDVHNLSSENTDNRVAKGDHTSSLEKNDIVPLNFKIKKESLENEGNNQENEQQKDCQSNMSTIKNIENLAAAITKSEEDHTKIKSMAISENYAEESSTKVKEESCSMQDVMELQKISEGKNMVPQEKDRNSEHETFYMEDEVAVVDLSKMNVAMNCSSLQGETLAPIMSSNVRQENQLHPIKTEESESKKEEQKVLNLSNKPDYREESLEMQRHYEQRYGENFEMFSQCPNCLGSYKSSQDLLQHIQNSQCRFVFDLANAKGTQHRICRICNITLKNFYSFIQHLYERHGIQGIYNLKQSSQVKPCKICGQKFLSEAYLREHVQGKHSSVRRYACTCGKTFKWRSSFSGHRRNCSGTISCINKPYPTTMCRYTRKRHGLNHSGSLVSNSGNMVPPPIVAKQEREQPLQPKQFSNDNGTGKIPGVHTILNDLKVRYPKPSAADTVSHLKTKEPSPLPPRAHADLTVQKMNSKSLSNSLKTDLNSPATQKIIESLKQRANVKWPTNKNSPSSSLKPEPKTINQHTPQPVTTANDPSKPMPVSSVAANFSKSHHSLNSTQTENNAFMHNSGNPYGMVFPVGDSMANLSQYIQYQNFGFNALNMQQLYHQMSASLSKIFSSENMKGDTNEKGLNRNVEKPSRENFPGQYVNKAPNKPRDIEFFGSSQKKPSPSSAAHTGGPLFCPACKMSFSDKMSLEMHVLKCKNRSMAVYTCSICGMKLRGKASLREHTLGKHSATRYSCSCGMKFKWRSSLGSHQKHCDQYLKHF